VELDEGTSDDTTVPGDELPRWRRALPVVLLAGAAFGAAIAMHKGLMPYDSGDRDEPVYRFQALMLRQGRLSIPLSQQTFFRPWLSGVHAGRLVMPFTLPWPALLALTGALGAPIAALGIAAGATTIGTYLLTRELLDDRRIALTATVLVSASPFVLTLSGTYLNYVTALVLELFAAWSLLRALRAESRIGWFVLSGLLWGFAFYCRPLDGALMAIPFAVFVLARRDDLRTQVRRAAWLVAGAIPVGIVILVVNARANGSPLTFAVSAQSGGAARLGWGMRGLYADDLTVDYSLGKAFHSLGMNLWALPTWLLGAHVALALAIYGGWRLHEADARRTWLLVAMTFVLPVGYIAWFASALTAPGAFTGIGPHYYLPAVVPLAVLAAVGGLDLWDRRRPAAFGTLALGAALTVVVVVPKVHVRNRDTNRDRRYVTQVERALRDRGNKPALVVLPESTHTDGVMRERGQLADTPDLKGEVLYALDRGPKLFDLLAEQKGRFPYRITNELRPGGSLSDVDAKVEPIRIVRGRDVHIATTLKVPFGAKRVWATIEQAGQVEMDAVAVSASAGSSFRVEWTIKDDGTVWLSIGDRGYLMRTELTREGVVGVGISTAAATSDDPDRSVRRVTYRLDPERHRVEASTATSSWVRFAGAKAWLPVAVDDQITVAFSAS
jgi:hypothetical protein